MAEGRAGEDREAPGTRSWSSLSGNSLDNAQLDDAPAQSAHSVSPPHLRLVLALALEFKTSNLDVNIRQRHVDPRSSIDSNLFQAGVYRVSSAQAVYLISISKSTVASMSTKTV